MTQTRDHKRTGLEHGMEWEWNGMEMGWKWNGTWIDGAGERTGKRWSERTDEQTSAGGRANGRASTDESTKQNDNKNTAHPEVYTTKNSESGEERRRILCGDVVWCGVGG